MFVIKKRDGTIVNTFKTRKEALEAKSSMRNFAAIHVGVGFDKDVVDGKYVGGRGGYAHALAEINNMKIVGLDD